jgi:hypothetical protein
VWRSTRGGRGRGCGCRILQICKRCLLS